MPYRKPPCRKTKYCRQARVRLKRRQEDCHIATNEVVGMKNEVQEIQSDDSSESSYATSHTTEMGVPAQTTNTSTSDNIQFGITDLQRVHDRYHSSPIVKNLRKKAIAYHFIWILGIPMRETWQSRGGAIDQTIEALKLTGKNMRLYVGHVFSEIEIILQNNLSDFNQEVVNKRAKILKLCD